MSLAYQGPLAEQAPPLIENVPAVVFRASSKDATGRTLFVTRNIDLYGYTPEDFTSGKKTWFSLVHPDDRLMVAKTIHDYKAKNISSFRLHYRLLARNGASFPVTEFNVVNCDAHGAILCYDSSILNTAHSEDQWLIDAHHRQQMVFNDILISLHDSNLDHALQIIMDRTGEYLDSSRVILSKDSPDHKRTKAVYEWCNKGISSEMALDYTVTYETDMPEVYVALRTKGCLLINNREIPENCREKFEGEGMIAAAMFAVYLEGRPYGFVTFDDCVIERVWDDDTVLFLQNIANLLSTVLARQHAAEALTRNQKSYEAVLNNVDSYIFVTHPESGVIIFANRAFRRVFDEDCVGAKVSRYLDLDALEVTNWRGGDEALDNPVTVYPEIFCAQSKQWLAVARDNITWVDGQSAQLVNCYDITEKKLFADAMRAANKAKSDFLAKTSHEVRTPMNAVTGMAELILREDISPDVRGYASAIKQAGHSLLAIVNDILDLSKIESGKLEIVPVRYLLSSLINDVVTIIRIRLMDKPLLFTVNVDSRLPDSFKGDEVRIRQILLNILGNAAKYTHSGFISLDVEGAPAENGKMILAFTVSDSGPGMRLEDQKKLFQDFVQVDIAANRGIEGTGLGLTITKNLCEVMDGSITVHSVYGEGSTFSIYIPQEPLSDLPLATVGEPEAKKIIIYENRRHYAESLGRTCANLGLVCRTVTGREEFFRLTQDKDVTHVFAGPDLYNDAEARLAALGCGVPVLLGDFIKAERDHVKTLAMPAHAITVANLLNDVQESQADGLVMNDFTAPSARVLVVDDNATNLKVAVGLMKPYAMHMETCLSGAEAVAMIAAKNYDLVLIDHMMPGMDGVEATIKVRNLPAPDGRFKNLPIVALTANVISGMREMFLENGLNDFLSKPIDTAKLHLILKKWLPRDKQTPLAPAPGSAPYAAQSLSPNIAPTLSHSIGPVDSGDIAPLSPLISPLATPPDIAQKVFEGGSGSIPEGSFIAGLSYEAGLASVGGEELSYLNVLATFRAGTAKALNAIDEAKRNGDLHSLVIYVHALKSSLASVGARELSGRAAAIEAAGHANKENEVMQSLGGFVENVQALLFSIEAYLASKQQSRSTLGEGNPALLRNELERILEALESFDTESTERSIKNLQQYKWSDAIFSDLTQLEEKILLFDYSAAKQHIARILAS